MFSEQYFQRKPMDDCFYYQRLQGITWIYSFLLLVPFLTGLYWQPTEAASGGVLQKRCSQIFAKLTRKHLCRSLFFNKTAGLRTASLSKKRLQHRCFPVSFANILRTPSLKEHLRWLFLNLIITKLEQHP